MPFNYVSSMHDITYTSNVSFEAEPSIQFIPSLKDAHERIRKTVVSKNL